MWKQHPIGKAQTAPDAVPSAPNAAEAGDLSNWMKQKGDTFAVTILKLMDLKHMDPVQCYKRANVTKNTFSKINNDASYRHSKSTVLCFTITLQLTLAETEHLLNTAGFSLSRSSASDMIIEFYITNSIYSSLEIDAALFQYNQDTLFSCM